MFKIDDNSIQIPSITLRSILTAGPAVLFGQILGELEESGIIPDELMDILTEYKASAEILMEDGFDEDPGQGTAQAAGVVDVFTNIFNDIIESAETHHVSVTFEGITNDDGELVDDPPSENEILTILTALIDEANHIIGNFIGVVHSRDFQEKGCITVLLNEPGEPTYNKTIETAYVELLRERLGHIQTAYRKIHKFVHAEYDKKSSNSILKEKYLLIDNNLQEIKFFFDGMNIPEIIERNLAIEAAQELFAFDMVYHELKYLLGYHPVV